MIVSNHGGQECAVQFFVLVVTCVVGDIEEAILDFGGRAMEMGFVFAIGVFDQEAKFINGLFWTFPMDLDMANGKRDSADGVR